MKKILVLLEEDIPAVLMVVTSLIIFIQVVLRYVFGQSIVWAEEFARYGIVFFVFLGSSLAVRQGAHASVDVLVKLLPRVPQRIVEIFAILVSIGYCVMVTRFGMELVIKVSAMGNITPTLEIPMYIPYLAIPIGCALMAVRYIMELVAKIKSPMEDKAL